MYHTFGIVTLVLARERKEGKEGRDVDAGFSWAGRTRAAGVDGWRTGAATAEDEATLGDITFDDVLMTRDGLDTT